MTSTGGTDGAPLDPDFAGLFRPEDIAAPIDASPVDASPVDASPVDDDVPPASAAGAPSTPGPVEDAPAAAPVAQPAVAEPSVDTGRLFRSQGVVGHEEAVLALSSDHFGRLRTLERRRDGEPVPAASSAAPSARADAEPEAAHAPDPTPSAVVTTDAVNEGGGRRRGARAITGGAVYLIVIGVTVLVAFANALLADGDLGWPTGVALLVSSTYAALTVRREDDTVAIIVPPLAFLAAALTAGQLFVGSLEGSLLNRAVVVFFNLADNWVWIIGSTVVALVIVLVRRRRG